MGILRPIAGDIVARLTTNTQGWTAGFRAGESAMAGFASTALRYASVIGAAFSVQKLISAASDTEETMNKFNVVFGSNAAVVKEWGDIYASSVGRSKQQIADFLSSNQDLFVPIGFDDQSATNISKSLTRLAVDVASFNNKVDSDVLRDFQSALTGGGETVKKYGVLINEAAVKQELLNQGIDPKQASDQQKVYARYQILLRGTTAAQGDAIRSGDSFANQQKSLTATIDDLSSALGDRLLPLATNGIKKLKSTIEDFTPWLERGVALFEWMSGDGEVLIGVLGKLVTAIVVVKGATIAWTVATRGFAAAQAFALALTPGGVLRVAAAIAAAGIATASMATFLDEQNNAARRLADSQQDVEDKTQSGTEANKRAATAVSDHSKELQKLRDEYNRLAFTEAQQLTRELLQQKAAFDEASKAGERTGLTLQQFQKLQVLQRLDASGYISALQDVQNELRILRGQATETSLELEKMAGFGVDSADIKKLREAYAERDRLQKQKDSDEKRAEEIKRREENQRSKLADTRNKAIDALKSPQQKSLEEFARLSREVQTLIQQGTLTEAQGFQYLDQERRKMLSDLEQRRTQVVTEAVSVRSEQANRQLVSLLNRRPDDTANELRRETNRILGQIKGEITRDKLATADFGRAA